MLYVHACCFQVEKLRESISEVRNMLANKDNESADTIKSSVHELQQKSLKLFEMAYKKVFKESCILDRPCTKKLLFLFLDQTYVVGTQKNRLNETVLLSTQNMCKTDG